MRARSVQRDAGVVAMVVIVKWTVALVVLGVITTKQEVQAIPAVFHAQLGNITIRLPRRMKIPARAVNVANIKVSKAPCTAIGVALGNSSQGVVLLTARNVNGEPLLNIL